MIPYLEVEGLTRFWGETALFSDISFTIAQGQKVALIAKNGAGKTTLLKTLMGQDTPDAGTVSFTNDVTIGYLNQIPDLNPDFTVIEEVYNTTSNVVGVIKEYEEAVNDTDKNRLQDAIEKMDRLNAWDFDVRIKQILSKLKITRFDQQIKTLSGGQQKRVAMANVLINEPDFIILDEPTNHLDLDMIEWLEEYLQQTNCTLFMVTHDRYFLDRVCNEILELENGNLFRYKGNYTYYLQKREERQEQMRAEVGKAKNIMRTELEWIRRMPKARGTKAKYRVDAFDDLKTKASQKLDERNLALNINASRLGKKVIDIYNLSKSFGDLKVLNDFTYKFARFEKAGVVGDNGTGKSTFLNIITNAMPADTGTLEIGETVKFGYYRQDGIAFSPEAKVIDVVTEIAEVIDFGNGNVWSASQFLAHFLFPYDVQNNFVERLSGGEKRRLYLCTILMQNPNFLILDEPTNDLDIMTLNVLEQYLQNFKGCVLVVSHDRYFMDKIVDHLFVFTDGGNVKDFPGNYSIYRDWQDEQERIKREQKREAAPKPKLEKTQNDKPRKLTFKEKREIEQLESEMATIESEKEELEMAMNSGDLDHEELKDKSVRYAEVKDLLDEKELRWLELSEVGT